MAGGWLDNSGTPGNVPPSTAVPLAPGAVAAAFQQALAHHQQGELAQAQALYQAVLQADPAHFDALHLLGVIEAQRQNPAAALDLISRALALDAGHAVVHYNQGLALLDLGRAAPAQASFERALALDAGYAQAWVGLGDALRHRAAHAEAVDAYDRALALQPHAIDALNNRGVALQALGRPAEALESFSHALALDPRHVDAMYGRGVALQSLQRNAEALEIYDAALALQPGLIGALNNRGLALQSLGRDAEALESLDQVLAALPAFAPALAARGQALSRVGRHAEALDNYARLLAAAPEDADAWLAHGNALDGLRRHAEALESFNRALALRPGHPAALGRRGQMLLRLRRYPEALADFDHLLSATPEDADADFNRGLALQGLGRHADALESYDRVLARLPDHVVTLTNRGNALHELGRGAAAIESFERVLAIDPQAAAAHYGLGVALYAMKRPAQALASFDLALALRPDYVDALSNRGAALQLMERSAEALATFDRVLALQPNHVDAIGNRARALQALGRHGEAAAAFGALLAVAPAALHAHGSRLYCQLNLCDWSEYAAATEQIRAAVRAGREATMTFPLLAVSPAAAELLQCARMEAQRNFPQSSAPLWTGEIYSHEKIRLAYISADFRDHPVSFLLAELLENHDRERFEIIGISLRPEDHGATGQRIKAACDRFVEVSALDDRAAARLLREMEIDIAVELSGYTMSGRPAILAHRPAPVQVNYLGFASTLGTRHLDYLIADARVITPADQMHYAEQVACLPDSFMPRDGTAVRGSGLPDRAAAGLPARGFVFCCFNNAFKFNPPVFDIWMRLLQAVEGSVLWLPDHGPAVLQNLRREARARGVDPDRLVIAARLSRMEDHLARLPLADLFLDTFPYNAHTTASDALWAGLPLLTRTGESFASRVAASLLHAIGLPELVTHNARDYEAMALRLATEPGLLAALRERLARNALTHPLFDGERHRRHLESAYRTMHERARHGLPPQSFTVATIEAPGRR